MPRFDTAHGYVGAKTPGTCVVGPQGVLPMLAYRGVRAVFLGLKFHLKAIFLGPKFANMNFQIFFFLGGGGRELLAIAIFSHLNYLIPQK